MRRVSLRVGEEEEERGEGMRVVVVGRVPS